MARKKAFTLIELLVVTAIIALLLSIILPSLKKAKKQAKGVICVSNLKQWGVIIEMYTQANDGYLHGEHTGDSAWQTAYRPYYSDVGDIRTCPEATKPYSEGGRVPFGAWGVFGANGNPPPYGFQEGDCGSYGANIWLQNGLEKSKEYFGRGLYWKKMGTMNVSLNRVPTFLECNWMSGVVNGRESAEFLIGVPVVAPDTIGGQPDGISRYMMPRHSKGQVGSGFLDLSARQVGLKELFRLKWHRKYDTSRWYEEQEAVGWPDWVEQAGSGNWR